MHDWKGRRRERYVRAGLGEGGERDESGGEEKWEEGGSHLGWIAGGESDVFFERLGTARLFSVGGIVDYVLFRLRTKYLC